MVRELVEKAGVQVTDHLSRNETKYVYKETEEEKVAMMLRTILGARSLPENEYATTVKQMIDKHTKNNSKLSAIFHNNDVLQFFLSPLQISHLFFESGVFTGRFVLETFRKDYGGVSTCTCMIHDEVTKFRRRAATIPVCGAYGEPIPVPVHALCVPDG